MPAVIKMSEKILLVDDEPAILQGYRRLLHRDFKIDIAVGGTEALAILAKDGPYAVVVSDMRMPGMNGIQLLSKIKAESPDTTRIMLTGNADIETAMTAINEGNIFRILVKPCPKELLAGTLTAGLEQHRLVTAEKELLEQTLSGSIHVLTEVLSLVNPAAFSRAQRLYRYISHVVNRLGLPGAWRFEIAAMMSQLGCVMLHPETIDAVYAGQKLTPEEQARFETHPQLGRDLISSIPRMEPIAWMIAHQRTVESSDESKPDGEMGPVAKLGAEILRISLAFDEAVCKGIEKSQALDEVRLKWHGADPRIVQALSEVEVEANQTSVRNCPIDQLVPGLILNEEVRTRTGLLIVAKGQEVTFPLILKLQNFHERGAINCDTLSVSAPKAPAPSTDAPKEGNAAAVAASPLTS